MIYSFIIENTNGNSVRVNENVSYVTFMLHGLSGITVFSNGGATTLPANIGDTAFLSATGALLLIGRGDA